MHLACTTVHQLQESWSDALVKVFAVRLAVLLVTLDASAPPSAAERRLTLTGVNEFSGIHSLIPCSFLQSSG